MPADARPAALTAEYDRLRGQRQARVDAQDAQAARLAEIERSPSAHDGWSRAEYAWWEARGARSRRRAADEHYAAHREQLRQNEPARQKLRARIAELADQRSALTARHRDEVAKLDQQGQKLSDDLGALESAPPFEEAA